MSMKLNFLLLFLESKISNFRDFTFLKLSQFTGDVFHTYPHFNSQNSKVK